MHDVALSVNSVNWYGWEEVRITRSITQIANDFVLKLTDKWQESDSARPINEGDKCTVSIDGETVITGYIDDCEHKYDDATHSIDVSGRDATGDLVDCSAPSFQWKGRSLKQGAEALCQPFHINVIDSVALNKAFTRLKSDEGESVFEVIETAARIRAVLLISDGLGNLVITRSGTQRMTGKLELGVNIKSGARKNSLRDRYSVYTVKGQTSDAWTDNASVSAKSNDKAVSRYRPKIILAEDVTDTSDCKNRATWHRNISAAKSQTFHYTYASWYLEGELLVPNKLVAVTDDYLGLNRELLIVTVAYLIDEQGLRAELTLALPEAFDLVELPEPDNDEGVW